MTREEAKTLLPVITAFAAGKDIQFYDTIRSAWHTALVINGTGLQWRVKPEPREAWVCFNCYAIRLYSLDICLNCSTKLMKYPVSHMRSVEDTV